MHTDSVLDETFVDKEVHVMSKWTLFALLTAAKHFGVFIIGLQMVYSFELYILLFGEKWALLILLLIASIGAALVMMSVVSYLHGCGMIHQYFFTKKIGRGKTSRG